jgi:hypothetical protein
MTGMTGKHIVRYRPFLLIAVVCRSVSTLATKLPRKHDRNRFRNPGWLDIEQILLSNLILNSTNKKKKSCGPSKKRRSDAEPVPAVMPNKRRFVYALPRSFIDCSNSGYFTD